jgi:hypothetical protein
MWRTRISTYLLIEEAILCNRGPALHLDLEGTKQSLTTGSSPTAVHSHAGLILSHPPLPVKRQAIPLLSFPARSQLEDALTAWHQPAGLLGTSFRTILPWDSRFAIDPYHYNDEVKVLVVALPPTSRITKKAWWRFFLPKLRPVPHNRW